MEHMSLKSFEVDITQPQKRQVYHLKQGFWDLFENSLINKGELVAEISTSKLVNGFQLLCHIHGAISLICDRSMEEFDHPIKIEKQINFKFGYENKELDVDSYVIEHHTTTLNVAQHLYELVSLAIPMKKIHPHYKTSTIDELLLRQ